MITLMKGAPVHKLLQMSKSFSIELVKYMIYQVAQYFEYLHEEGILYRDLKASNLLLDETGIVKLVDFGLSKEIGENGKTKSICGTAHSLPPEIYDPEGYGYSIDYFSLGILAFELLTG
jgi:serine/threonine protein kinase